MAFGKPSARYNVGTQAHGLPADLVASDCGTNPLSSKEGNGASAKVDRSGQASLPAALTRGLARSGRLRPVRGNARAHAKRSRALPREKAPRRLRPSPKWFPETK